VDKDIETLAVRAIWATHADLDEDVAYAVTKALFENTDTLAIVHVKGKEISIQTALESVSVPLHPGAERYYREKGIIK
jgi:TRAP transporter TAXI family solute receptor